MGDAIIPGDSPDDFQALLDGIVQNPDAAADALTPERIAQMSAEQVLKVRKAINPYGGVPASTGGPKRSLLAYTTNLRQNYCTKFAVTGVIGFLRRVEAEWSPPVEVRTWVPRRRNKVTGREAEGDGAAWDADEFLSQAEALVEIAKAAVAAERAAAAPVEAAQLAEQARKEADLLSGEGKTAEEKAASREAFAAAVKAEGDALRAADAALAKASGALYTVAYLTRDVGGKADERIDALGRAASVFPDNRELIKKHGVKRSKVAEIVMPEKVAKKLIKSFHDEWFEYNPDAHVRSAYDEVVVQDKVADVEVPGLAGTYPQDTSDPERIPLAAVLCDPPAFADAADAAAFADLTETDRTFNAACHLFRARHLAAAFRRATRDDAARAVFVRALLTVSKKGAAAAAAMTIPPADTFHRLNYYMEKNYEELRSAVASIYHDKPTLDYTILPLAVIEGDTEAELAKKFDEYKVKHEDEIVAELKRIPMNEGWAMLGDWKENRETISFFNKHTDAVKRILDRLIEDQKLGADLMRKRVFKEKAANIAEAGPDAPGLEHFAARGGGTSAMAHGAEKVIGREQMMRLERARGNLKAARELEAIDSYRREVDDLTERAKMGPLSADDKRALTRALKDLRLAEEMIEVPDDAIQVDVFRTDGKTGKMSKSKFYTQAEAPKPRETDAEVRAGIAAERAALAAEKAAAAERAPAGGGGAKP